MSEFGCPHGMTNYCAKCFTKLEQLEDELKKVYAEGYNAGLKKAAEFVEDFYGDDELHGKFLKLLILGIDGLTIFPSDRGGKR
jgi:hypothetical protein